ncbi:MAG: glycosyltransferase family 2 protein [Natronomonas sp.]
METPEINRVVETIATAVGVGGLLLFGYVTGVDIWTLTLAPVFAPIAFFEGQVYLGLFSFVIAVSGLILAGDIWRSDDRQGALTSGPPVRAIVPAYRDADVVNVSVESLVENEYDPLGVTIVVEPGDEPTRKRAVELADRYDAVEWVVNERPGSKATAINYAVERSSEEYFVVFDADERASSAFVAGAMAELTEGTDVFQGRRIPRPSGAIETIAYCERIVVQAGYLIGELAGFTHCQSSATGFTRDAFETVGGYADVLTEDIYFSHQCYQAGLTVTRNRHYTSTMEPPHTLQDLWGQRKRWRIGHVQVSHLRTREAIGENPAFSDLVAVGRAVGAVLGGGALIVLSAHVLLLAALGVGTAFVPLAAIFGMVLGVWSKDFRDGRVGWPAWTVVLVPLVYLGHGLLTAKALFEYALTWDGEWYQVSKSGV